MKALRKDIKVTLCFKNRIKSQSPLLLSNQLSSGGKSIYHACPFINPGYLVTGKPAMTNISAVEWLFMVQRSSNESNMCKA